MMTHSQADELPKVTDSADTIWNKYIVNVVLSKYGGITSYYWNNVKLEVGDICVIETEDGLNFGQVVLGKRTTPCQKGGNCSKIKGKVHRKATKVDLDRFSELAKKESDTFLYCRRAISDLNLEMNLSQVRFTFDGLRAVILFTSEKRVDFRELVKMLARFTGTNVEFKQIGIRDEAKVGGDCGICGNSLCCSSFMTKFNPISVSMAKNQGLSLNSDKLTGLCGRLKCCLGYENNAYESILKSNPSLRSTIYDLEGNEAKIVYTNLLGESVALSFKDHPPIMVNLKDIVKDNSGSYVVDRNLVKQEQDIADSKKLYESINESSELDREKDRRQHSNPKQTDQNKQHNRPKQTDQNKQHNRPKQTDQNKQHSRPKQTDQNKQHNRPKQTDQNKQHNRPKQTDQNKQHSRPKQTDQNKQHSKPEQADQNKQHSNQEQTPTRKNRKRGFRRRRG
ncbi:MAG: regulatory iron-sulfur-containing complex subunit RicT [Nitrospinota bacterium]